MTVNILKKSRLQIMITLLFACLCVFGVSSPVFARDESSTIDTTIQVRMHSVTISLDGIGYFIVDGQSYTSPHTFYYADGKEFSFSVAPEDEWKLAYIRCMDPDAKITIKGNQVFCGELNGDLNLALDMQQVSPTGQPDQQSDQKPSGSSGNSFRTSTSGKGVAVPKTGDAADLFTWTAALTGSALLLILVLAARKRRGGYFNA